MKQKASRLLQLNANKKLIQQQLTKETGNVILLKDLSNIASAARCGHSRNNLDVAVATLLEKYGTFAYDV